MISAYLIRITKGEIDKHSEFFKAILLESYKNTVD